MQAAFMAPTELLAEQHARNFERLLDPLGMRPVLLTGSLGGGASGRRPTPASRARRRSSRWARTRSCSRAPPSAGSASR